MEEQILSQKASLSHPLITLIAVVEFDIDVGQIVRHIYPQSILSAAEEKSVSNTSFPDSNAFSQPEGSMEFIFRMKRIDETGVGSGGSTTSRFTLGYTCFRQRKDPESTRGYKQQSVVILSQFPLLNFFSSVSSIIAKSTIEPDADVSKIIQESYDEILSWRIVGGGFKNKLSFRDCSLELEIPWYLKMFSSSVREENQTQVAAVRSIENSQQPVIIENMLSVFDCAEEGFFQEINVFRTLKRSKIHILWKLWEVVITNQPLMIIADSPHQSSQLVFAALSLISPLQYIGDYRPYLTIYNAEYKAIKERCDHNVQKNVLVGVTNPFFLKTLATFPVILRLDSAYSTQKTEITKPKKDKSGKEFPFLVSQKNMKILINYNKNIDKMLLPTDSAETDAINNSLVRKQFRQLTQQFLGVFDDFLSAQRNIFDRKEFRKYLESRQFAFAELFDKKKKILALYEKFMISANFLSYIKQKNNIYFSKVP